MEHWQKVRLGDILTESKVESIFPNNELRIRVLLNAKGVIKRPIKKETKGATKYFTRKKGQFIYGKQNIHKGAFGIVSDELDGFESTSDLPAFDVDDSCLPLWIDYYLKQGGFYLSLVNIARGAATKRVQPKELLELKIPLPSVEEQEKVIAHFKSVETEDGELKQELTYQQTLLKKLRQQILKEAIEGKLTRQWRINNEKLTVEPASELLKRIQAEKEQLIKDRKIKKQKPLPPISEDEKLFELPKGWEWCRTGALLNKFSTGPFGSMLHKSDYVAKGIPLVNPANIVNGAIVPSGKMMIDKKTRERLSRYILKAGEFVIARRGDLSKCALVSTQEEDWLCGTGSFFIQPSEFISKEFFLKVYRSLFFQQRLAGASVGQTMANLNQKILNNAILPLPPLPEQKAIVTKVEKLLAFCDQLESQITSKQTHAEQLMQAVLKEAFSQNYKPEKKNNVFQLEPSNIGHYKLALLAAEIVDQLHKEPTLGHLKLQKLIYLCQKTQHLQLPTNFLKQAAGPYDPEMARLVARQLKQEKWFDYRGGELLKYRPLEKAGTHKADFMKYFANQQQGINGLLSLFREEKSDWMEIVATLYACWEEMLEKQEGFSETLLIERFYAWSEEKSKYEEERIRKAIEWMQEKSIAPER